MKPNGLDELKQRIGGKRVMKIEHSRWSGRVRAVLNNDHYVSMTLEDGTVLEVGSLFIRETDRLPPLLVSSTK